MPLSIGVTCYLAIDCQKNDLIPKLGFWLNRNLKHEALTLGPGIEYKCEEGEKKENTNKQKQPFVPYTNLKNTMLISFQCHGNFFLANLTWNDTGKWILKNVISTKLNWFKTITLQINLTFEICLWS